MLWSDLLLAVVRRNRPAQYFMCHLLQAMRTKQRPQAVRHVVQKSAKCKHMDYNYLTQALKTYITESQRILCISEAFLPHLSFHVSSFPRTKAVNTIICEENWS